MLRPHDKILAAAAKTTLSPLGVVQKGRSRTWLDDQKWWVCVVEFQPSDWSRGSYLNVGCCWLWHVKDYFSFDEGSRVENLVSFETVDQFEVEANRLADRAAQEVKRYRKLFPDPAAVATFYLSSSPTDFWKQFNAAIATALSGQSDLAERLFQIVSRDDGDVREWLVTARKDARLLSSMLQTPELFRSELISRILRARQLLKLPSFEATTSVF